MDDREIGGLWRQAKQDETDPWTTRAWKGAVCELIKALVEERTEKLEIACWWQHGSADACTHDHRSEALIAFEIDPSTWPDKLPRENR